MNPLGAIVEFVGPQRSLKLFGIRLVGINADTGHKLLFTIVFIIVLLLLNQAAQKLVRWIPSGGRGKRIGFWVRQGVRLVTAVVLLVGIVSIWFEQPSRLATFLGLVSAGLAFALQKVVTAVAGYFVILRGKTFNVGDRITMGGVRGDVIALGFIQTTIMEMGQPPAEQDAEPAMWVRARQYTGRIVTVTNDKVFDTPVYNYTREFPYIWDEIMVPITYQADRARAEQILLDAAERLTVKFTDLSEDALREMERRYVMNRSDIHARVYYRLTDNWLELSLRFICKDHGVRELKDAMSRQIIAQLDQAGIGIASSTYDVVGFPPIHLVRDRSDGGQDASHSQQGKN